MEGACAKCCGTYLFLTYASGTIVFLLLAIFANAGNVALLMEHCHKDGDIISEEEKGNVQKRTYLQYYFACAISLILSIILYVFCISGNTKIDNKQGYYQEIHLDLKNEQNITPQDTNKMPIELAQEKTGSAINSGNSLDSRGMGENEI